MGAEVETSTAAEVVPPSDVAPAKSRGLWGRRGSRRTPKNLAEPVEEIAAEPAVDQAPSNAQPSDSVIHDAGAALWRELTGSRAAVVPSAVSAEPVDVDAAMLEAELWEREVEEAEARGRAEREARERAEREAQEAAAREGQERAAVEAREREAEDRADREAREVKAREALRRVEEEALRLAEQEAQELAERAAQAKAEQEARGLAEQEARERAEREAQ